MNHSDESHLYIPLYARLCYPLRDIILQLYTCGPPQLSYIIVRSTKYSVHTLPSQNSVNVDPAYIFKLVILAFYYICILCLC